MKPTPGPWRATKAGASVKAESGEVAYIARRQTGEKERAANANMIAAACNAAQEINPENPIAAAEACPQIIVAARLIIDYHLLNFWEYEERYGKPGDDEETKLAERLQAAIAKAAARE